jgi:hypothetical protein
MSALCPLYPQRVTVALFALCALRAREEHQTDPLRGAAAMPLAGGGGALVRCARTPFVVHSRGHAELGKP